MILKLAWRNIWRQKTRTIVIISSITVGIWAGILMTGFAIGMVEGYLSSAILNIYSHIQVHHPDYKDDFAAIQPLHELDSRAIELEALEGIAGVAERTVVNGMASSSRSSRGVKIVGIYPTQERQVTEIHQNIKEGEYLDSSSTNRILISLSLAEKLDLKLRSKLVLTFQSRTGDIAASAYRIAGLFETNNQMYDESNVFVLKTGLDPLVNPAFPQGIFSNEIAILIDDKNELVHLSSQVSRLFSDDKVETYRELSPDLNLYESQIQSISLIYIVVIMLALIFGIINTMLMAVLERIRELGMLISIGMTKSRIFGMIIAETIMLSIIAIPIGLLLGIGSIGLLSQTGINLEAFAEGVRRFGISPVIYPAVPISAYINIVVAVVITSILASLYPGIKAINLNPVEAIRQI